MLSRIQAHLSTQSSSKIPEVVKKFSGKILLEEVPRLSAWPTQFLKDQPQDDSVGLYFFAQDIERYLVFFFCNTSVMFLRVCTEFLSASHAAIQSTTAFCNV